MDYQKFNITYLPFLSTCHQCFVSVRMLMLCSLLHECWSATTISLNQNTQTKYDLLFTKRKYIETQPMTTTIFETFELIRDSSLSLKPRTLNQNLM